MGKQYLPRLRLFFRSSVALRSVVVQTVRYLDLRSLYMYATAVRERLQPSLTQFLVSTTVPKAIPMVVAGTVDNRFMKQKVASAKAHRVTIITV